MIFLLFLLLVACTQTCLLLIMRTTLFDKTIHILRIQSMQIEQLVRSICIHIATLLHKENVIKDQIVQFNNVVYYYDEQKTYQCYATTKRVENNFYEITIDCRQESKRSIRYQGLIENKNNGFTLISCKKIEK